MEHQVRRIREQQKESWHRSSSGWRKWDLLFMDFLAPAGEEIIRALDLKETDAVLDVASGTGEPGLTIASKVGQGRVMITDLVADMVTVAKDMATRKRLSNVETCVCDVSDLPFPDNSFDAVSCRFGFMFFPDLLQAAKEITRVLKPGGKIAVAVWNTPEKNFWVSAIMQPLNKYQDMPPPQPGDQGMFRCSEENMLTGIMANAGLKNIQTTEVKNKLNCKTAEFYWSVMTDVAAPVVAALSKMDESTIQNVRAEVYQVLNERYPAGNVVIDSSALVISAEK